MQFAHARESSNSPADSQTVENCTRANGAQCAALNIIQTLDVAGWHTWQFTLQLPNCHLLIVLIFDTLTHAQSVHTLTLQAHSCCTFWLVPSCVLPYIIWCMACFVCLSLGTTLVSWNCYIGSRIWFLSSWRLCCSSLCSVLLPYKYF